MILGETVRGEMQSAAEKDARAAKTPRAAVAPAPSRARRHARGAALWATVGFVCGAVFWHAVGFWTFMSRLMFDGEAVAAQVAQDPGTSIETGSLPTIVHIDPARCTSLELNRSSNRTAERPCPRDGLALRYETDKQRGDLAFIVDSSLR